MKPHFSRSARKGPCSSSVVKNGTQPRGSRSQRPGRGQGETKKGERAEPMSWSSPISSPLPCACQNRRVRDLVTHRCNAPNDTLSFIYRQIVVSLQISSHGDLPVFLGPYSRPLVNLVRHDCDELSHGAPNPRDLGANVIGITSASFHTKGSLTSVWHTPHCGREDRRGTGSQAASKNM